MKIGRSLGIIALIILTGVAVSQKGVFAADDATSLVDAFKQGKFHGELKSYYYAETYDGEGLHDSSIWVNGGNLSYNTDKFYGAMLGATFQAAFVSYRDDEDKKMIGSMDANGAVLSEAYLDYTLMNTGFKGFRQYMSLPLSSGSGSRFIKESFEAYLLTNKDIPDTTVTVGMLTKYQTRSDQSNYGDNWFVEFDQNGSGDAGDFYDIGDDGMLVIYAKNTSVNNLALQAQYGNVFDQVAGFYADAKYTFDVQFKPYISAQFFFTDYDDSMKDSNELFGFKGGAKFADIELFAGFTTTGGDEGEARVFRGVGQGSYYHYTATTKTSGVLAFEADTDAYQVGGAYSSNSLSAMVRATIFDLPAANADLDEYTLNLAYKFGGWAQGFSIAADFSILDYDNDQKDATDLRTRLIYAF